MDMFSFSKSIIQKSKAQDLYYNLAVLKHDLKRFTKLWYSGFTAWFSLFVRLSYELSGFLPPDGKTKPWLYICLHRFNSFIICPLKNQKKKRKGSTKPGLYIFVHSFIHFYYMFNKQKCPWRARLRLDFICTLSYVYIRLLLVHKKHAPGWQD